MRFYLWVLAVSLFLAGPVWAQNWHVNPDGASAAPVRTTSDVTKNAPVAYFDFEDTTDSVVLRVADCDSISVNFNSDEDGTNTGAEVYIRQCEEGGTVSANHCSLVAVDINGDGQITAADEQTLTGAVGRRGFRGLKLGVPYIYVDINANPATADDARVTVTCEAS